MSKEIFKIGDRVFDIKHGWGTVALRLKESEDPYYRWRVDFTYHREGYTDEGKSKISDAYRSLSFTEYDLINGGFSQERPINYDDYIGKCGKFWDNNKRIVVVGKLINYLPHLVAAFEMKVRNNRTASYENFEPLTEEQIKVLGLCD